MAVATTLVLGGVTPAEAATAASQWSQPGYGPGRNYYNPQESVVNASTIKEAKVRWSFSRQEGSPGCNAAPQAPLVVDGRAFVLDGDGVAALDAKTGKRLWDLSFSAITADLVIVGDLLMVTDTSCYSNSDYDGYVTALDVRTGVARWRTTGSWIVDTIVADAGMVVTSGYCGICDTDWKHGVIGIRASDGAQMWSYSTMVLAGPVSASGRVLLTGTDWQSDFVADIKTGAPLYYPGSGWKPTAATPAGDRFYATSLAGLSAVDARTARSSGPSRRRTATWRRTAAGSTWLRPGASIRTTRSPASCYGLGRWPIQSSSSEREACCTSRQARARCRSCRLPTARP
jgi:outer membrane protein assembly factor BamB